MSKISRPFAASILCCRTLIIESCRITLEAPSVFRFKTCQALTSHPYIDSVGVDVEADRKSRLCIYTRMHRWNELWERERGREREREWVCDVFWCGKICLFSEMWQGTVLYMTSHTTYSSLVCYAICLVTILSCIVASAQHDIAGYSLMGMQSCTYIHPSIQLSIRPCMRAYLHPSIPPSLPPSIHPSIRPWPSYLSIHPAIHASTHASMCVWHEQQHVVVVKLAIWYADQYVQMCAYVYIYTYI